MRSRAFVSLYIAVFVATMGISMVSPLLPVYARDLGASGVWLGLTFSVFAIVQAIFGPFAGKLSDRFGRKPFIVTGLLIYLVAALGYLTAHNFYQVIAFRAFSGLGTSLIFSVARAYVGDLTPRGHEGRWFGVFATADIIGFGTGPLLAGLLRQEVGFRAVFVAMAALMAASALIVMVSLPWHGRAGRPSAAIPEPTPSAGFKAALRNRLVLALTVHQGIMSLSFGASFSFLALRLEGDLHTAPIFIGLAFATQDITGGLAQPIFGRLADRHNRRLLVALGLLGNALFLVTLGFVNLYLLAVLSLMAMGATGAISGVAASAMQVVAGRRVGMGTVLGLGSASNGIGIVVGSVVGGLLIDQFALYAAFVFGGAMMAGGVAVFWWLTRGVPTSEPVEFSLIEGAAVAGV